MSVCAANTIDSSQLALIAASAKAIVLHLQRRCKQHTTTLLGILEIHATSSPENLINGACFLVSLLHHAVPEHLPAVAETAIAWYSRLSVRDWLTCGLPAALISATGEVTADILMCTFCEGRTALLFLTLVVIGKCEQQATADVGLVQEGTLWCTSALHGSRVSCGSHCGMVILCASRIPYVSHATQRTSPTMPAHPPALVPFRNMQRWS